uniref:Uncharacterized protein n=1 Tax=Anguilla anguilla TaxID=7936 RepID=A0A0E9UR93_ANGAN
MCVFFIWCRKTANQTLKINRGPPTNIFFEREWRKTQSEDCINYGIARIYNKKPAHSSCEPWEGSWILPIRLSEDQEERRGNRKERRLSLPNS